MIRFMAVFVIFVVEISLARSAVSQATPSWLPIKKSEFVKLFAKKMNLPRTEVKSFDAWLTATRLELPARSRELVWAEKQFTNSGKFLLPGETLWLSGTGYKGNIVFVLAVRGERIHSFRVHVIGANMLEVEQRRTQSFLSSLYEKIFPDWPEARQWPQKALEAAWKVVERGMQGNRDIRPNDIFIRTRRHGITSTTFGVLPDFIIYSVTVRQNCIPNAAFGELLKRQIC